MPNQPRPVGVSVLGWLLVAGGIMACVLAFGIYVIRSAMGEIELPTGDSDLFGSAEVVFRLLTAPAWVLASLESAVALVSLALGWGLLQQRSLARRAAVALTMAGVLAWFGYVVWFGAILLRATGRYGAPAGFNVVAVGLLFMQVVIVVGVGGTVVWYLRTPAVRAAFG